MVRIRTVVVFPAPLRPSSAHTVPLSTARLTSTRARVAPKERARCSALIARVPGTASRVSVGAPEARRGSCPGAPGPGQRAQLGRYAGMAGERGKSRRRMAHLSDRVRHGHSGSPVQRGTPRADGGSRKLAVASDPDGSQARARRLRRRDRGQHLHELGDPPRSSTWVGGSDSPRRCSGCSPPGRRPGQHLGGGHRLAGQQGWLGAEVVIGSNIFDLAALLGLGADRRGSDRVFHRKVVVLSGTVALSVTIVCFATVMDIISSPTRIRPGASPCWCRMSWCYGMRSTQRRRLPLPRRWASSLASAVDEEEFELVVAIRPAGERSGPAGRGPGADRRDPGDHGRGHSASALRRHYAVAAVVTRCLVLAAVTSLPPAVATVGLEQPGARRRAALSTTFTSNALNVTAGLLIPTLLVSWPGHPARHSSSPPGMSA